MLYRTELSDQPIQIPSHKNVYFASDFHLGAPDYRHSRQREDKIIRWLTSIQEQAAMIFLLGDQFDFWFEYKHVVPKGYVRLLGKLAELKDRGIPIHIFSGNHDMWMFDYFTQELDIPVHHHPISIVLNQVKFYVGHGDGLGPGDKTYKLIKRFFRSSVCQWLFAKIHPDLGIGIAQYWSGTSRKKNLKKDEAFQCKEKEWIYLHCLEIEKKEHHDYYVFGHRHLPLDIPLHEQSRYMNIGEWISQFTFGKFDGHTLSIQQYQDER